MIRALRAPLTVPWIQIALLIVVAVNVVLALPIIVRPETWFFTDYRLFSEVGERIASGQTPYHLTGDGISYRYSPLLAWAFHLAAPLGHWGWTLLSVTPLLLLLRDWRLVVAVMVAVPFWADVESGVTFAFVPMLAMAAMRGSFGSGLAIAALTALIPRLMMLPILGYLLWKQPALRLPALIVIVALTLGALATGWGDDWIGHVLTVPDAQASDLHWMTPVAILGPLWLLMLPVAGWLFYRQHIGLAAMAISPYWTASYPLILLLELLTPATYKHLRLDATKNM